MIGSIDRLANGRYRVRYYDGSRDHRGRPRQRTSEVVDTRIEVEALRRRINAEVGRQREMTQVVQAGRLLSFGAVLTRWSESRKASGRIGDGRAWEVTNTLRPIAQVEKWSTTAAITADVVDRWMTARIAAGGSDNPLRYLQTILRWASGPPLRQPIDQGVLQMERRLYQSRPQPDLLTDAQLQRCLDEARRKGGDHVAQAFEHLATYGCRPTELCKVLVADFDPAAGTITYTKTKNGRRVTHPLLPQHIAAYTVLAADAAPEDHLFTDPWGEPWRIGARGQAAQLTSWWRDNVAMELLSGPQRGIYCLKDYAISRMESLGIDDRTKALFTGHSTLAVFARYKATNRDRADAALLRLAGQQHADPRRADAAQTPAASREAVTPPSAPPATGSPRIPPVPGARTVRSST